MSRRCCPSVEEGMAWGRGRWGCMAVNSGRGKEKRQHRQGRMRRVSPWERKAEKLRRARAPAAAGALLCVLAAARPLYLSPPMENTGRHCSFPASSRLFCAFQNSRWLIKRPRLPFCCCLVSFVRSLTHRPPPLIPQSGTRRTGTRSSAHKREGSSSFIPASSSTTGLLFRTLCVRPSHFLVQAWTNDDPGAICDRFKSLIWPAELEELIYQ